MSQIMATVRTLSRAFSRATRAAQAGKAIYARAWFREPRLMNILDELNNLACLSHIDMIGVTETWLHDELKDHEVSLPGYVRFCQDCPSSKRGGVALYVKSNLRPQLMTPHLPTSPPPRFVNLIVCDLLNNTDPAVLILAYRSPNTPPNDTTTFLCTLLVLASAFTQGGLSRHHQSR